MLLAVTLPLVTGLARSPIRASLTVFSHPSGNRLFLCNRSCFLDLLRPFFCLVQHRWLTRLLWFKLNGVN